MSALAVTALAGPMIKITDLHQRFGLHEVLKGIHLEVAPREVVSIIGPSGSGKSTLLQCVNRLQHVHRGHIWIEDEDILAKGVDVNRLCRKVGMVFQHFNLFENKTALDNVILAPVKLGLAAKVAAWPRNLSGGQKQCVAIARALAINPDVMKDLARGSRTMMVVTHEMGFACEVSHRMLFMDDGVVVEDAPPEQFFNRPQSPRTKAFLEKIL